MEMRNPFPFPCSSVLKANCIANTYFVSSLCTNLELCKAYSSLLSISTITDLTLPIFLPSVALNIPLKIGRQDT